MRVHSNSNAARVLSNCSMLQITKRLQTPFFSFLSWCLFFVVVALVALVVIVFAVVVFCLFFHFFLGTFFLNGSLACWATVEDKLPLVSLLTDV